MDQFDRIPFIKALRKDVTAVFISDAWGAVTFNMYLATSLFMAEPVFEYAYF